MIEQSGRWAVAASDVELDGLTAAELLAETAALIAERNRIDARLARVTRRAELTQAPEHDGLRSMPSWLKGHGRLSGRAAKTLVRTGRVLEQLPAVATGCDSGWSRPSRWGGSPRGGRRGHWTK